MTPIYKKKGRRYVEIGVYDPEEMYYPHGAHLIVARPGGTLTQYSIEPAWAAVDAAIVTAKDAMLEAMREASKMKLLGPQGRALTAKERKGWDAYCQIVGKDTGITLQGALANDIVQAGLDAVRARIKS